METKEQIQPCVEGVRRYLDEHITSAGDSQDNRAMLASINAYKQAIEKALGEKR